MKQPFASHTALVPVLACIASILFSANLYQFLQHTFRKWNFECPTDTAECHNMPAQEWHVHINSVSPAPHEPTSIHLLRAPHSVEISVDHSQEIQDMVDRTASVLVLLQKARALHVEVDDSELEQDNSASGM